MIVTPAGTQVAVVTGAGRGFGLEIARRLLARGFTVVFTDVDDAAVAEGAELLGTGAHGLVADAREASAHRATAAAARELGPVAVWVNNAGVARAAKIWEHPDEDVELTVRVNLLGVMHGSRAAVEVMQPSGGGHILNIASMSAFGPVPGLGVYAATKAGVLSFTTSLQGDLDLAGVPIRMHALCPDAADTRMVSDVAGEPEAALLFSGLGLLTPEKVADAALDLLDGRRIVKSMPLYRSGLIRFSNLVPTAGLMTLGVFRRIGEQRRRRAAR
jgi:NAD(P)-dependent dehydrogenase (short-subunit alcohol dehydrogenase family)